MINYKNLIVKESKGVGLDEVENKRHNIWLGISMSNKFFTLPTIKLLIEFASEYTKNKIIVLIPGRLQGTNYRYFDGLSRAEALRKSFEDEDKLIAEVKAIISKLSHNQQRKVVIANYDDICTPKHMRQKELLFREFSRQVDFYNAVMKVVEEVTLARGRTYNKQRGESLAIYVLNELPLFVDGVQKNGDSTVYTAVPYPGFGKIADLEMDIIEGKKFPDLTEKLQLSNKVGILDIEVK